MINILKIVAFGVGALCLLESAHPTSHAAMLLAGAKRHEEIQMRKRQQTEPKISPTQDTTVNIDFPNRSHAAMLIAGAERQEEIQMRKRQQTEPKISPTQDTTVNIDFPKEPAEIVALFEAAHTSGQSLYVYKRITDYSLQNVDEFRMALCGLFHLKEEMTLKDICDQKLQEYRETGKITYYGDSSVAVEQSAPISTTPATDVSNEFGGCCNCMWTCTIM